MRSDSEAARILADPGTSRWLHGALRTAMDAPNLVELVRDCEFLLNFLGRRLQEVEQERKRRLSESGH